MLEIFFPTSFRYFFFFFFSQLHQSYNDVGKKKKLITDRCHFSADYFPFIRSEIEWHQMANRASFFENYVYTEMDERERERDCDSSEISIRVRG